MPTYSSLIVLNNQTKNVNTAICGISLQLLNQIILYVLNADIGHRDGEIQKLVTYFFLELFHQKGWDHILFSLFVWLRVFFRIQ